MTTVTSKCSQPARGPASQLKPWQVSAGHTGHLCGGSHTSSTPSLWPSRLQDRLQAGCTLLRRLLSRKILLLFPWIPNRRPSSCSSQLLMAGGDSTTGRQGENGCRSFPTRKAMGASGLRAPRKARRVPVDMLRCAGHPRCLPLSLLPGVASHGARRPRHGQACLLTAGECLSPNRLPFCWL